MVSYSHRLKADISCANSTGHIMCFYEKVIKVKADVAALLYLISVFFRLARQFHRPSVSCFFTFLVLGGFCHISTENLALGSLRSDDWQLGRPTVPPVLSVLP